MVRILTHYLYLQMKRIQKDVMCFHAVLQCHMIYNLKKKKNVFRVSVLQTDSDLSQLLYLCLFFSAMLVNVFTKSSTVTCFKKKCRAKYAIQHKCCLLSNIAYVFQTHLQFRYILYPRLLM